MAKVSGKGRQKTEVSNAILGRSKAGEAKPTGGSKTGPQATAGAGRESPGTVGVGDQPGAGGTSTATAVYRKAIVTFIDLLGFKQLISSLTPEELRTIIRAFYYTGDASETTGPDVEPGLQVFAFSDSIVRIREADYPSGLFHEILSLVHMQGGLATRGVLIRGGITYGDIFTEGTTVFGPALVRAYELESMNALYPRIIIDPVLLNLFEAGGLTLPIQHDHQWESGYVQNLIHQAEDGFWLVDYLRAYACEIDEPERYPEYLALHAKVISESAKRAGSSLGIAAKINWLATYHDRVVSELDEEQLQAHGAEKAQLFSHGDTRFSFSTKPPSGMDHNDYWVRRTHSQ